MDWRGGCEEADNNDFGGFCVNKLGLAVGLMVIGVVLILFAVFQHFAQSHSPVQIAHGAIIFSVLGVLALAGGVATYFLKGGSSDSASANPANVWAKRDPSDTLP